MTQERFSRIVDDPELLRTITYEELKTLALAYPYAHNLWYFLAIKGRQIDHPDVVKNVATAAAYSLDRMQLFRLVAPQMIAPQQVWMEEEVLELKPIETLKRKLEEELTAVERTEVPAEVPPVSLAAPAPEIPETTTTFTTEIVDQIPEPEEILEEISPIPQIPYQSFSAWYDAFNPPLIIKTAPETTVHITAPPAQEPPAAVSQISEEDIEDQSIGDDEPAEQRHVKPGNIAQLLAEKSVAENKDVISETLAKLFVKQGYRDKAIAMYERLILAFPEKSAYFAAEIDKLKK